MSTSVIQPSFRAVLGQTHAKWQALEKPENKRQMYGSQARVDCMDNHFKQVYKSKSQTFLKNYSSTKIYRI